MHSVFALLLAFQVKHFLADYPLQTPYMLGKFKSGLDWIAPLAAHCWVHAFFTFIICLAFLFNMPGGIVFSALCGVFDFTIHFGMDRIKASPALLGRFKAVSAAEYRLCVADQSGSKMMSDTLKSNTYFWWSLGFDQFVHHLTHYAIIWRILKWA